MYLWNIIDKRPFPHTGYVASNNKSTLSVDYPIIAKNFESNN